MNFFLCCLTNNFPFFMARWRSRGGWDRRKTGKLQWDLHFKLKNTFFCRNCKFLQKLQTFCRNYKFLSKLVNYKSNSRVHAAALAGWELLDQKVTYFFLKLAFYQKFFSSL
jgi:hypothetical protein